MQAYKRAFAPAGPRRGYWPGLPDVIAGFDPRLISTGVVFAANQLRTIRMTCHRAGDIRDVSAWIVASSGNVAMAIYDTGDASAGNRSRLWSSGSVVCGSLGAWQTIDPGAGACPVREGQVIELAMVADNATASIGRTTDFASGISQLPSTMGVPSGGALPKLAATVNTAFPPPTSIAEANLVANNTAPGLIARIA